MKKFNKLFTFLIATTLLVGCANDKDKTVSAKITDSTSTVASSNNEKTGTLQDLYNSVYTDSSVLNSVFATIAKEELLKGMTQEELTALIASRRQEELDDLVDNESYQDTSATNGVISLFNERLLVRDLRLSGYNITCENNVYGPELNDDYTYKAGTIFKCDYTDYFEKALDENILKQLLIEKYILSERPTLLDRNKTVKVNYLGIPAADYSYIKESAPTISYTVTEEPTIGHYVLVSTEYIEITEANQAEYIGDETTYEGSYYIRHETENKSKETARTKQFMIDAVAAIKNGSTFADIEQEWEEIQKEVEQYTYDNSCPFDSSLSLSSQESSCANYTNSGAYDDTVGLKVKMYEIGETEYVHEEVISSSSTIFNETILANLFADNVSNRLHELVSESGVNYLISTAIPTGTTAIADNDIIVNDATNSYYYLIQVELINSELSDENALKQEGAKYLAANNSTIVSSALEFYLTKYSITVHDQTFFDYLESTYTRIDFNR